ncbi:uncharacterized protein N0V89_003726 [Didymosphaeria variabile]|uniref:Uncharacterized protein n=1 Tax=Didymosphaeria variabile TaxID=1932322 RepID=A0A9W9CCZ5_9PLEO|nr:uncharacterized protein N0V89_003726 [Didymosphaeria variabile]KAJ4355706.1 hypothetical protein N0V89_003726 [Didymosphaeria variabile]
MPHSVDDETTAPAQLNGTTPPAQLNGTTPPAQSTRTTAAPNLLVLFRRMINVALNTYERWSAREELGRRPCTVEIQPGSTTETLLITYHSPAGHMPATARIHIRHRNPPTSLVTLPGTNSDSIQRNSYAEMMFRTNLNTLRTAARVPNEVSIRDGLEHSYEQLFIETDVSLSVTSAADQDCLFVATFSMEIQASHVHSFEQHGAPGQQNVGVPATDGEANDDTAWEMDGEITDEWANGDNTDGEVDGDTNGGMNGNRIID